MQSKINFHTDTREGRRAAKWKRISRTAVFWIAYLVASIYALGYALSTATIY